jgi:hypothetical protein
LSNVNRDAGIIQELFIEAFRAGIEDCTHSEAQIVASLRAVARNLHFPDGLLTDDLRQAFRAGKALDHHWKGFL